MQMDLKRYVLRKKLLKNLVLIHLLMNEQILGDEDVR